MTTVQTEYKESFPRLYKIGRNDAILQWDVRVERYVPDSDPYPTWGEIVIEHGQVDGEIQTAKEMVSEGKNVGRANETTPLGQACLQAESRWKKQLDKGYRTTIEEARKALSSRIVPMLAEKLSDKAHKLVPGKRYARQPKLDGMRCVAERTEEGVNLWTRKGKPIESVPHIVEELTNILTPGQIWDGELYVHGMEFEKIMSIARRKAKNMHPEYLSMQFHIFDVVDEEKPFEARLDDLGILEAYLEGSYGGSALRIVKTTFFTYEGEEQLLPLADLYAEEGYEGLIMRDLEMGYEHNRSIQLIKVKRFQDAEFRIVGTQPGKKGTADADLLVKFDVEYTRIDKNHVGEIDTCEATLMGTKEARHEMLTRRDEYIGKHATIVFQELSKKGALRFAKVKAIRELDENLCPIE